MWWQLIGSILGSAAGEAASRMDKDEAMRLIRSVQDEMGKINVPALKQLFLEKVKDTELNGIKDDPTYRAQQNAADAQLNDVINSGGLTLADRAALNRIRQGSARQESAGRSAIEQGMAARGSLDSGAQLAMQLQGNQQAANRASEDDARTSAAAQQRVFQGIQQRAQNAGQGLDRDYRQKSEAARAQDAINAGNAAIANTANRYNAGIPQQDFENKMKLAGGKAGATYASAGASAANAKDTQQAWQGMGNMAGAAGQSGYDAYKAQKSPPVTNLGQPSDTVTVPVGKDEMPGYDFEQGLGGQSTRREVVGHRPDGSPIYRDELK